MVTKMYLGDAVYASFDGYHIWLKTSNGYQTTNAIALEPGVLNTFDMFRKQLQTPEPQPQLLCDQCGQPAPSHDFGCEGEHRYGG